MPLEDEPAASQSTFTLLQALMDRRTETAAGGANVLPSMLDAQFQTGNNASAPTVGGGAHPPLF